MSDDVPLIIVWSHGATFPFVGCRLKQTTPPLLSATEIAGPVKGNPLRRGNTLWLPPSLRGRLCRFFLAYTSGIFLFSTFVCFCSPLLHNIRIRSVAWNARGHVLVFISNRRALFCLWSEPQLSVFLHLAKKKEILWKEKSFFKEPHIIFIEYHCTKTQ